MAKITTANELLARADDRSYTPSDTALRAAFDCLDSVDKSDARSLERLILRGGESAARVAAAVSWQTLVHPERWFRLAVRLESAYPQRVTGFRGALADALQSENPVLVRQAIRCVAKLGDRMLFERWIAPMPDVQDPAMRRAVLECAGRCGGEVAEAVLAKSAAETATATMPLDEHEEKVRARAQLMVTRERLRQTDEDGIERIVEPVLGIAWNPKISVRLVCRQGVEYWLAEELMRIGIAPVSIEKGEVIAKAADAAMLDPLWSLRTVLAWELSSGDSSLASFLENSDMRAQIRALFGKEQLRFRVRYESDRGGKSQIWELASAATEAWPQLVNEPRASDLELVVRPDSTNGFAYAWRVRWRPDRRFGYREQDIPAASHPTIAAGLVIAAKLRPGDVVWDPFAGSGLELIEAKLCVSDIHCIGTDIDTRAIEVARTNARAAGVDVQWEVADARNYPLPKLQRVISNPPHGRRVSREEDLVELHAAVLMRALDALAVNGEIHWLSPRPREMAELARRRGARVVGGARIDLGGVFVQYQKIVKQARPRGARSRPR